MAIKSTRSATIPATLQAVIATFLAEGSPSKGGFAKVGPKDEEQLAGIIRQLIAAKYETDPDGDLPLSFDLIDRTRYMNYHFFPVRHFHDDRKEEEGLNVLDLHEEMRSAQANVGMAQEQVKQVLVQMEFGLFRPLQEGGSVRAGDRSYEQVTSFTTYEALEAATGAALEAYVATHSPVDMMEGYEAKQAWINASTKAMEEALGISVEMRLYYGREPEVICASATLTGHDSRRIMRRFNRITGALLPKI